MGTNTSLLKWLNEDLKKKVEENLDGHNLSIIGVGNKTLYARCLDQDAQPLYKVLVGKQKDVELRAKQCQGIRIPTYDKEVVIIAQPR